jgi:hypothetical protein
MWAQPPHYFDISLDPTGTFVNYLNPDYAAKGIRVGDRVDLAVMPFRERAILYEDIWYAAPERLTVAVKRGATTRAATVETLVYEPSFDQAVGAFGEKIVAMAYILVAVVLVWSRPTIRLWGLAVFLISWHPTYFEHLESPLLAALSIVAWNVVDALGVPGIIVFAARFLDDRSTAATKYWYLVAAALFVYKFWYETYFFAPLFTTRPIADLPDWATSTFTTVLYVLVFPILCFNLLRAENRSSSRSFRWVAAGYAVGIVLGSGIMGYVVQNYAFATSPWLFVVREALMLAFPVSVAYAIIRHRAFGLGYLTNRTLVYAMFSGAAVSTIVIGIWTASAELTSAIGIALAMFVAALVGMTLQASRRYVVRFVDRVFLRRRHQVAVALDNLRSALRGSSDARDLTADVAETLGLSSLAVFSRTPDGGFVRKAAVGWPPGSTWHLLPGEALTRLLDEGAALVPIAYESNDDEPALPSADARPRHALTLRRGDRVERAILVGPQRTGTIIDRDAMRSLQRLFEEAILV